MFKTKKLIFINMFIMSFVLFVFGNDAKAYEDLSPRMWVESPAYNSVITKNIGIAGWALNASGVKEVNILLDGQTLGKADISTLRADVNSVYKGYPTAKGFKYGLDINYISPGKHTIGVETVGIDGTKANQNIVINIDKLKPLLWVESPAYNSVITKNIDIAGWTLNSSDVKEVNIFIDGQAKGKADISSQRPDVNTVYRGYPTAKGFKYGLDINYISPGKHTIGIEAIGNDGTTVKQNTVINIEKLNPLMWIETPVNNITIKNNIDISGWTLNSSDVKEVNIFIDGQAKGKADISSQRPDVNTVYRGYPTAKGFKYGLDINYISPGKHTIGIEAIGNDGTTVKQNTVINIEKLSPLMWIETPINNSILTNDLIISGWSLNASGVNEINVFVDDQLVGKTNTIIARPDVNATYPGYPKGDRSGYQFSLTFDSIVIGSHTITVQVLGNDGTENKQSINIKKGNAYIGYTNYNITFDEFVNKQIGNTPALSVNGEWRYAQIQNGEQGYYIETSAGRQWYKDLQQYNAIKQEIINKADPNILAKDSTQIYQFIKLSYIDGILASDLNSIFLSSGVLNGKGQVFMDAAKKFNVNPVYLAAHAIHETGNGTSKLARGITVNGVKVYNLFGIGAVDGDPEGAGSRKAYEKGWDTIDKAIYGGAEWISNGYINAGQDTLYKMRWNPIKPTVHQYATDVRWAYGQAFKYKSLFDSLKNIKLVFDIPIFK